MEYGQELSNQSQLQKFELNTQYNRFVGYEQNQELNNFFSNDTVNFISKKITQLLEGVHPENKHIVVPNKNIIAVMNQVQSNFRPPVGDIYSRLHIISQNKVEDYNPEMIDQVIETITSYVRNTIEIEENNKKLTIWTTVYGDFNAHGLKRHSQTKGIRHKRPTPFQFHMKY
jgi:hypothetical protein